MPLSNVQCFPSLEGSQCTLLTHGGVRGQHGRGFRSMSFSVGLIERVYVTGGFFSEEFVKKISFVRLQSRFP